eukprot:SAG31_NODE_16646_length_701_cov_1.421927_1_plen_46_part_01
MHFVCLQKFGWKDKLHTNLQQLATRKARHRGRIRLWRATRSARPCL